MDGRRIDKVLINRVRRDGGGSPEDGAEPSA
jgi:hypothetical protein